MPLESVCAGCEIVQTYLKLFLVPSNQAVLCETISAQKVSSYSNYQMLPYTWLKYTCTSLKIMRLKSAIITATEPSRFSFVLHLPQWLWKCPWHTFDNPFPHETVAALFNIIIKTKLNIVTTNTYYISISILFKNMLFFKKIYPYFLYTTANFT